MREYWSTNLYQLTRVALDKFFEVSLLLRARNRDCTSMSKSSLITSKQKIHDQLCKMSSSHATSDQVGQLCEQLAASQKRTVQEHVEQKETQISSHMWSLDALQLTIKSLEMQVNRLKQDSDRAQELLQQKRTQLHENLIELLRLEKVIKQIELEISNKSQQLQKQLADIENEKFRITNDLSLLSEAKQQRIDQLNLELRRLSSSATKDLRILQERKESFKNKSRVQAEMLQDFIGDLRAHHRQEIKDLEARKIGASPSEIIRLEEELCQKQNQFTETLKQIEHSIGRQQFYFDENGRYYVDLLGKKIYKQDSFGSEKILSADGKWTSLKQENIFKYGQAELDEHKTIHDAYSITKDKEQTIFKPKEISHTTSHIVENQPSKRINSNGKKNESSLFGICSIQLFFRAATRWQPSVY